MSMVRNIVVVAGNCQRDERGAPTGAVLGTVLCACRRRVGGAAVRVNARRMSETFAGAQAREDLGIYTLPGLGGAAVQALG